MPWLTPEHPNQTDWSGTVALVLAVAIGLAVVILALAAGWAEARRGTAVSPEVANLLSTVLGAAIGAVATFLGVSYRASRETQPDPRNPADTKEQP